MSEVKPRQSWTYLSNHAHVLIAVAKDPETRVRDLAALVGITERAVLQILSDLEGAGAIVRHRLDHALHDASLADRPGAMRGSAETGEPARFPHARRGL